MIRQIYSKLFIRKNYCSHERINTIGSGKFCPDCGKEVFISWLIIRCKCCSVKREAKLYLKSVIPVDKFCSKCGSEKYYVEKKAKLDIYDIYYAVLSKEEMNEEKIPAGKTQIWVESENESYVKPRLIPYILK